MRDHRAGSGTVEGRTRGTTGGAPGGNPIGPCAVGLVHVLLLFLPLTCGLAGAAQADEGTGSAEARTLERFEIEFVRADPEEILRYDGPLPTIEPGEIPYTTRSTPMAGVGPDAAWPGRGPESLALVPPAPQSLAPPPLKEIEGMWISLTSVIPPDTHGAVGPNHVASMLNSGWAVWHKSTGGMVFGYPWWPLGRFWLLLGPAANGPFDPKVIYDQDSGRWIVVALSDQNGPNSHILLAVSTSSDPTKPFLLAAIRADENGRDWADFPCIGVDPDLITISVNMARVGGTTPLESRIYFIDKQAALSGGPVPVWRMDESDQVWQPCHAFGPTAVNYLISGDWYYQGPPPDDRFRSRLKILEFSYDPAGPSVRDTGFIEVRRYSRIVGEEAPQASCSKGIHTGETRLHNAVLRHGKIWTSHTVADWTDDDPEQDAIIQWYEIDPGRATHSDPFGWPLQTGRIGGPGRSHVYPSIAVNRDECVAIGFSYTDPNTHPSAYYTLREVGDPRGSTEQPRLLKAGEDSYYRVDAKGRNRWGDYSATVVDPDDDHTFWTIQEYAKPEFWPFSCDGLFPNLSGSWGTWWGMFRCPENQKPVITCNDPVLPTSPGRCDAEADVGTIATCTDPDGDRVTAEAVPSGPYPVGTTSVEVTCSDPLPHHVVRKTCRVSVEDWEAPTCTPPAPTTLECNTLGGVSGTDPQVQGWLGSASATDNCAVTSFTNDAPALFPSGCGGRATTVTHTARDAAGNSGTCSSVLTVEDTKPPVPTAPGPITLECNTLGGVDGADPQITGWLAGASAADICEGPIAPTNNAPSFFPSDCPPGSATTVTFTATDSCRNSASEDSAVTVQDTQPPVLTVPAPITLECNTTGGVDGADPQVTDWLAQAAAADVCEGPIGPANDAPGFFPSDCPPGHTTPVNFDAADSCANATRDSSSTTVQDTTAPDVLVDVTACCLWPPNHRLLEVAGYAITDVCDGAPVFAGGTVMSDEDPALEPGTGGPVHAPDALVGGGLVHVRAERAGPAGTDNGRVYGSIAVSGADNCANTGTTTVTDGGCGACPGAVCVPHDQDPKTPGQNPGRDPTGPCPAVDDGQFHQASP